MDNSYREKMRRMSKYLDIANYEEADLYDIWETELELVDICIQIEVDDMDWEFFLSKYFNSQVRSQMENSHPRRLGMPGRMCLDLLKMELGISNIPKYVKDVGFIDTDEIKSTLILTSSVAQILNVTCSSVYNREGLRSIREIASMIGTGRLLNLDTNLEYIREQIHVYFKKCNYDSRTDYN